MSRTCSQRPSRSTHNRLGGAAQRLRERTRQESGFTLLELLVVVLIVGALAAIAIPSFIGQKGKAVDAQAKVMARTAETTAEVISTDNNGEYAKVTPEELNRYEHTIQIAPSTSAAYLSAAVPGKSEYSVTVTATNGDEFTISRTAAGGVSRTCASPIQKTGCAGGEKSSW